MLQEYITIKWHNKNKKILEDNGYEFTNYGDDIVIKTIHLPISSNKRVDVCCDVCKVCNNIKYQDYQKIIKIDGLYRCIKCGHEKRKKTCLEKYGFTSL